jgi:hypothetical protein
MRFLQAAIVPVLTLTILAFSSVDADAAKGVKKNSAHKIEGKVVSATVKNGMGTVTVKTHHHKKKNAAGNANAGAAKNQAAAKAGGKKGKGHTQEFTVDAATKITSMGTGGGKGSGKGAGAAKGKGKGRGKGANRGGGNQIRTGDFVMATIGANHKATSVQVKHAMQGKGKGKNKAVANN